MSYFRLDQVVLVAWQVGRFMRDEHTRQQMLARLYPSFRKSREAFWSLNNDLLGTLFSRLRQHKRLRLFNRPVRIIFGHDDVPESGRGPAVPSAPPDVGSVSAPHGPSLCAGGRTAEGRRSHYVGRWGTQCRAGS